MPTPEFVLSLREKIGHDLLWLPAVTAVVLREDGRVLLARRSDNGNWGLVSGIVEPGEEPAVTAVRECLEETGVEGRDVGGVELDCLHCPAEQFGCLSQAGLDLDARRGRVLEEDDQLVGRGPLRERQKRGSSSGPSRHPRLTPEPLTASPRRALDPPHRPSTTRTQRATRWRTTSSRRAHRI